VRSGSAVQIPAPVGFPVLAQRQVLVLEAGVTGQEPSVVRGTQTRASAVREVRGDVGPTTAPLNSQVDDLRPGMAALPLVDAVFVDVDAASSVQHETEHRSDDHRPGDRHQEYAALVGEGEDGHEHDQPGPETVEQPTSGRLPKGGPEACQHAGVTTDVSGWYRHLDLATANRPSDGRPKVRTDSRGPIGYGSAGRRPNRVNFDRAPEALCGE
jgi:hypothetical protein